MIKQTTDYTIEIYASVDSGLIAQILFNNNNVFAGRIDFYRNAPTPASYLWHPNSTTDESQIYIVLAMPEDLFEAITQLIRNEKPWNLELWPNGALFGAFTDGYGGVLYNGDQSVGAGANRSIFRALRK